MKKRSYVSAFAPRETQGLLNSLDEFQEAAMDEFRNKKNVFVTGSGGCGKTHLLLALFEYLKSVGRGGKKSAIISPTGVTALMVSGRTFSSFFGFGINEGTPLEMWNLVKNNSFIKKQIKCVTLLVIDEISMISAEQLEAACFVCQMIKNNRLLAFGGIQVVICGDFSQLPPIKGRYAFRSEVWRMLSLCYVELKGNHRQQHDEAFFMMLNRVRRGIVDVFVRNTLQSRVNAALEESAEPTELCARRADAERINEIRIEGLDASTEELFVAELIWIKTSTLTPGQRDFREKQILKNMITPATLKLRIGAVVMLTYNIDLSKRLANGSMGHVTGYEAVTNYPIVFFFKNKNEIVVKPREWECKDSIDSSVVVFKQIPLILAYATTIHKAQGATLDYVKMKIDNSLQQEGQAYVALSRCRTLDGITLTGAFQPSAIRTNQEVVDFYNEHNLLQDVLV